MTAKTESLKDRYQNLHGYSVRHVGPDGSAVVTNPAYTFTVYDAYSRVRSGGPVPNYRRRISAGVDASGSYSVDATRTHYGSGSVYTEWNSKNYHPEGPRDSTELTGTMDLPPFGGFVDFSSSVTSARNDAFGRFWSAASQIESRGSTMIGELRETVRMLRHPFSGALSLLDGYFSGLRKNAPSIRRMSSRRKLGYLADQWLEVQFGWTPLISDAKSTLDAIIRLSSETEYVPIRAHASRSTGTTSPPVMIQPAGYARLIRYQRTIQRVDVTCRGAYRLRLFSELPLESVADNFGFLPSGFVPTVWELIPYSFAVDYFTNIGDILASAFVARGNIAWSNYSQVIREENVCTYGPGVNTSLTSPALSGFQTGGHGESRRERYRFTRGVGVPSPDFQVSLPGLKQSVNLAALIAQWRSTSRSL